MAQDFRTAPRVCSPSMGQCPCCNNDWEGRDNGRTASLWERICSGRMDCLVGCWESVPTAPEEIIPDPGRTEACVFTLKSTGLLSRDYVAYRGESTGSRRCCQDSTSKERARVFGDATKKWQFVNKSGSLFEGDAIIDIENFLRGGNPDKPDQGEVGWHCEFNSSPYFEKNNPHPWGQQQKMNWKLETSAGISPGANRWHKKIAEGFTLNVHASGRAVCRYHRESCTDPGNWTHNRIMA